ncbi:conserved hypothetical protein [Desulfamplus magnetovallimortis]|uniref:DUF374 domain-containing protein n=1 Tax=Desulfamplus magnetovallimortis TaxID=1246637 RepID=A0A1W1H546_9BACT|nr:lysophospholipid acyltransferase family protein [Desulfamplus magnetovallimortis]SLM27599.1 conserved hypothetical protein [Desulfamplus magnetovallimortis]
MFKKLKWLVYKWPFTAILYYFIKLYALTFRLTVKHEKEWQNLLKKGETIVLCTWHQQFFAAISYFKRYTPLNPALMISRSRDGELIAAVAKRSGWHTARGSSSVGGKEAMDEMIKHLNTHGFGAHITDGPQGPLGIVKPGLIKMAMESNAIIVPFYTSSDNAWFFNSWDRFMLPKPFSRVTLNFGAPIHLPIPETPHEFEQQRQNVEKIMKVHLLVVS